MCAIRSINSPTNHWLGKTSLPKTNHIHMVLQDVEPFFHRGAPSVSNGAAKVLSSCSIEEPCHPGVIGPRNAHFPLAWVYDLYIHTKDRACRSDSRPNALTYEFYEKFPHI